MMGRQKLLRLLVLCLLLAFSFSHSASAASSGTNLTTSPVLLDLKISPGSSVVRTLQLMNNGVSAVKINMKLEEFKASGNTGQANIIPPAANDVSPSWVSFSPSSFSAPPGVWSSVKMTINLPKTAQLGYYYAAIFEPDITAQALPKSSTIKGYNGILVLVDTQSGNEQRSVNLASFTVSKKVYEYLPATFTVNVHNSGNIYLAPFGNVYISRSSTVSSSLAALGVNSTGGNVLPNSSRSFQVTWSDGFPSFATKTVDGQVVKDKHGQVVEQLRWDFTKLNKFRFGKYYAKLTLVYNNGVRAIPISGVVSFWVIPWKLMLIVLLAAVLIGLGLWSLSRGLIRRIRKVGRKK